MEDTEEKADGKEPCSLRIERELLTSTGDITRRNRIKLAKKEPYFKKKVYAGTRSFWAQAKRGVM